MSDARETLRAAHLEVRSAYWERKDIAAVCATGWAEIERGLEAAERVEGEARAAILGAVKSIAYDVGSFAWPGWDEPGIEIGPDELSAGAQAAALNLRLATELGRDEKVLASAHWLVGAHELAAGDPEAAVIAFAAARACADVAADRAQILLAEGYDAIARGDRVGLERVRTAFADVEEGAAYVEQLDTAARVFTR